MQSLDLCCRGLHTNSWSIFLHLSLINCAFLRVPHCLFINCCWVVNCNTYFSRISQKWSETVLEICLMQAAGVWWLGIQPATWCTAAWQMESDTSWHWCAHHARTARRWPSFSPISKLKWKFHHQMSSGALRVLVSSKQKSLDRHLWACLIETSICLRVQSLYHIFMSHAAHCCTNIVKCPCNFLWQYHYDLHFL